MRRALVGLSVLAIVLGFDARAALAAGPLNFQGGPMKNLYVDLIFWGNFSATDRQQVLDNVNQLSYWLNGGSSGPGLEPAVHYYGVSGITPGTWLQYAIPIAPQYLAGGGVQLDDNVFQPLIGQARAGVFGAAYDFQTNDFDPSHIANQSGLPFGSNRLALVVTKGTGTYCADAGDSSLGICAPDPASGYHWWSDSPYGAVMSESLPTLSHEVMEAMTDPHPYLNTGYGWITQPISSSASKLATIAPILGPTDSQRLQSTIRSFTETIWRSVVTSKFQSNTLRWRRPSNTASDRSLFPYFTSM